MTFTIDQIKSAHSKVKSGADFPVYIQDLKKLGVKSYETYVNDGRTEYHGAANYSTASPARHESRTISETCDVTNFKLHLKEHQQGKTDFPTFIKMCADCGVEKWAVSTEKMTCTYFDKKGAEVLIEVVPGD